MKVSKYESVVPAYGITLINNKSMNHYLLMIELGSRLVTVSFKRKGYNL